MKNVKSTIVALLMTGVAVGAVVPALAQQAPDAPPPAAAPGNGPGPDLKRFDTNGDGTVTLDEIQAARKAEVAALQAGSHDGKLTEEDLVNAEMARLRPIIEARVKARIAAQDVDGDGMLSAAELATPPLPEWMLRKLANGDGKISLDEMRAEHERMMERRMEWRGDFGPDRCGPMPGGMEGGPMMHGGKMGGGKMGGHMDGHGQPRGPKGQPPVPPAGSDQNAN